jgi:hypothetical protein
MKVILSLMMVVSILAARAQADTISIVSYNVLNFPDGRDDCGVNTVVDNKVDTLKKILDYLTPDIFVACEVQTEVGALSILNDALNVGGTTNYAMANFLEIGTLNNSMYYNSDKLILKEQNRIETVPRAIDHYVLYANDPNLGTFFDTTFIEVYMCHLKAGNSNSNEEIRATQTEMLMDYVASRPLSSNHFFCGDLNVYSSFEDGYQNLISGPFAFVDPINTGGNWNNNASFAHTHTQSTRTSMNFDCGSKGGLDDRFDQILVSQNVMTGADSLRYLQGSYDAVGNDGNHFNSNLINGTNTQYPTDIVSALYHMSDHLPVILKAVVTYPTSNGLALYPEVEPVSCFGGQDGEATIVANMGQPPYTYLWDANAGNQTSATATGLPSGVYCVEVTDALNEVDEYCIFVPQPDGFDGTIFRQPDNGNCTGQASIVLSGGTPPYTYSWNDANNQTGSSASGLCQGTYELTVTDDDGCSIIYEVDIDGPMNTMDNALTPVFEVFPNPVSTQIHLVSKFEIDVNDIICTNNLGQIQDIQFSTNGNNQYIADTKNLKSGVYILKYTAAQHQIIKRIVISID